MVNPADQNKQQPQEDACHVPYMTSQYEIKPLIDTCQYLQIIIIYLYIYLFSLCP